MIYNWLGKKEFKIINLNRGIIMVCSCNNDEICLLGLSQDQDLVQDNVPSEVILAHLLAADHVAGAKMADASSLWVDQDHCRRVAHHADLDPELHIQEIKLLKGIRYS